MTLVAIGVYLRRIAPIAAVGIGTGCLVLVDVLGPDMTDHTGGPFFAVLLITYTAGARLEGRRLAAAFLLGSALVIVSIIVRTRATRSRA